MIIQYAAELEFHDLEKDGTPEFAPFLGCVILTPEGMRVASYVGHDPDFKPKDGQAVIDGFLRGGWWFTAVTYWAYLNDALPKEEDLKLLGEMA